MNNISLVGRITKELELRFTQNNNPVCEFSLAVNRIGSDDADFINCTLYGKQAENLTKYQGKGSLIAVSGALRVDSWKNEQGENRYKTYVLVNNVEYLGTKKEGQPVEQPAEQPKEDPFVAMKYEVENDETSMELPF